MESLLDKVPPQHLEAEQSVLGAMLLDREAVVRCEGRLVPESFYRDAHRAIFEAVMSLSERNEAADVITVADELRRLGKLEAAGGISYLTELANIVPTAANVEHYARIVEEKYIMRRLIGAATEISRRVYEGSDDVPTLIDRAEHAIFEIAQGRSRRSYAPLKDILIDTFDQLEQLYHHRGSVIGIPTGLRDLDRITSGFRDSDMIVLAARPSQGKTALALTMAVNAAVRHNIPVGIFSLEMSRDQLALRLLAAESAVNAHRLRTGDIPNDAWPKLSYALGKLGEAPIYIDDTPNISIMDLRAQARRMQRDFGIRFLMVDYLQLMHTRGRSESRQQEISEISRSLKALARELRLPILALSQLSRAVEQRTDRRPQLSDLRESGAIEQDADMVMFIYHNPEMQDKGLVELVVAKQRNGPTGSVNMVFMKDILRFADAAEVGR